MTFCKFLVTTLSFVGIVQPGVTKTVQDISTTQSEWAKISVARLTMKNSGYAGDQTSAIPKRNLKFTKKIAASLVKVTYVDNLRTFGNDNWCRWWIRIDGKDCAVPIHNTVHTASIYDNDHAPHAIVGTCAGIKPGSHTMTIALTRSTGADCFTGWSPSSAHDAFFMEAEELNPAGQITTVMRQVGADGRDSGVVSGRSLKFTKRTDASQLRITWGTNLSVHAKNDKSSASCNWELRIDGKSCSKPSKIGVSMNSQGDDNDHIPVEVVGWCQGIKTGRHDITVAVSPGSENSDCYTGWDSNDYMEVWEPTPQEQSMITYMQKVGTDNGSDQSASVLASSFTKKSSSSSVRILYYDNLRVYGNNRWCRWEVTVDGKSCPVPLAGSVYTRFGDNDHYPATILGECPGLAAGKHNINIALTRGSSGADCYTGWTPAPRVMHALIEVQETSQHAASSTHGWTRVRHQPLGVKLLCTRLNVGKRYHPHYQTKYDKVEKCLHACLHLVKDCDAVNYLPKNGKCAFMKCGGVINTGAKSADHGKSFVSYIYVKPSPSSCKEGYFMYNGACHLKRCSCWGGTAPTGKDCMIHGQQKCSSCWDGYDMNHGQRGCFQKRCTCENGYAARGKDCKTNGVAQCTKCSPGFSLTRDRKCRARQCTCEHGRGATGKDCPKEGGPTCAACDRGYLLDSTGRTPKCSLMKQCKCPGGRASSGIACPANGAVACDACAVGFFLDPNHQCQEKTCVCNSSGGTPARGSACPKNGFEKCYSCPEGEYVGSHNECVVNECLCANGLGATGRDCPTNSMAKCSSCRGSYYLDRHSHTCKPIRDWLNEGERIIGSIFDNSGDDTPVVVHGRKLRGAQP